MNLFEVIIFDIILITVPLLLYLFYIAYKQNIGQKETDLFLNFALISSLYFITRLHADRYSEISLLLCSVPLIIAYLYDKKYSALLISVALIMNYSDVYSMPIFYFIVVYVLFFILYLLHKKYRWNKQKFIDYYIGLKMVSYTILIVTMNVYSQVWYYNMISAILAVILLFLVTNFVEILFKTGQNILKFHMTLKELEHEKQIRMSLFKITHEIKNPIAVCKGYLDMFDINNVEHSKKYIPIMKEEIARTLILLQDFLSMTKIKIEKDILDIHLLLEEVTESFIPILKEHHIEKEFTISEEEVYLYADYNRISQVLINIIKNSIEAMDEGGTLKISTKLDQSTIHILIEDNGHGITKENLKKIKEPFFTTKQKGTGLGISLSDEIIRAHGGTMKYRSKEGSGTAVELTLKLYQE